MGAAVLIVAVAGWLASTVAAASPLPGPDHVGFRGVAEYKDDRNIRQQGIVARWRHGEAGDPPRRLSWDLFFGTIHHGSTDRVTLSLGPSWRVVGHRAGGRWSLDLGLHPTLLGGAKFGDWDLGGVVQFTSFLSLGRELGRERRVHAAFRVQHISNGGLNDTNPGADMAGFEVRWALGPRSHRRVAGLAAARPRR